MSFSVFQVRWLYYVEYKIILHLFIPQKGKKAWVRNVTGDLIGSLQLREANFNVGFMFHCLLHHFKMFAVTEG